MASNQYGMEPLTTVGRYSRAEHRRVDVPCPSLIKKYNAGMGGVDLLDSSVALYRVNWRKRKWYWPIYNWSLSIMAVNAWRLRERYTGTKEPYLKFLRELVVCLLQKNGTPPIQTRRSLEVPLRLREKER